MMKNSFSLHSLRPAVAMIELIFAIVVIGITLLSVPNLVSLSNRSGYTSMQQEAVATASSDLSLILSRHWDEGNTNDSIGSPILRTNATSSDQSLYNSDYDVPEREGGRTRSFNISSGGYINATLPADLGNDTGDRDDMDDYNGVVTQVSGATASTQAVDTADKNIKITTSINYVSDVGSASWNSSQNIQYDFNPTGAIPVASTNIKRVNIRLETDATASEVDKNITLNAFSCNIGSYALERREL